MTYWRLGHGVGAKEVEVQEGNSQEMEAFNYGLVRLDEISRLCAGLSYSLQV